MSDMPMTKTKLATVIVAGFFIVFGLSSCSSMALGAPGSTSYQYEAPSGERIEVNMVSKMGYTMEPNGTFLKDDAAVASLTFFTGDEYFRQSDGAAKDGLNYKKIEINGDNGIYYETYTEGQYAYCYLVKLTGTNTGIGIAARSEQDASAILNLIDAHSR